METFILICSSARTWKQNPWYIPIVFFWYETLSGIQDRLGRGKRKDKFHLSFYDESIQFNINELLPMENVVGIDICYKVGHSQRV